MPGIQAIKLGTSLNNGKKEKDPIYGFIKTKKGKVREHPLFEDLKKSQTRDKTEFARLMKQREILRDPNGFDSLKLLGSHNDSHYLDSFMSMPRRRVSMGELLPQHNSSKPISKSPSTGVMSKGTKSSKGGSLHSSSDSNLTLALIHSLRNSESEDSIYESVEMIHYRKTMDQMNRQRKIRSVQKTGHPLFDHLREEQALREDSPRKRPARRQCATPLNPNLVYNGNSQGNSPSPSSSSSGDEYDLYPRMQFSKSRKALQESPKARTLPKEPAKENYPVSSQTLKRQEKQKQPKLKSSKSDYNLSNESDEDWVIPRPRFFKFSGSPRRRMDEAPLSTTSDESDASSKSAGLR